MSSTDVLIYVDVISNKQSIFSSQIRTPSFPINWLSLVSTTRSPIILLIEGTQIWYTFAQTWFKKISDQSICNLRPQIKSDQICDARKQTYLVWLMYWLLFNQRWQHRTNQKQRSWANAVFQNCGVCGQAFPTFPSPSPVIPFFVLVPTFSTNSRWNVCCAGYGLLEIKCPLKLWNLTPEKACSDPRFYCHIVNGKPELKREHIFQGHLG